MIRLFIFNASELIIPFSPAEPAQEGGKVQARSLLMNFRLDGLELV